MESPNDVALVGPLAPLIDRVFGHAFEEMKSIKDGIIAAEQKLLAPPEPPVVETPVQPVGKGGKNSKTQHRRSETPSTAQTARSADPPPEPPQTESSAEGAGKDAPPRAKDAWRARAEAIANEGDERVRSFDAGAQWLKDRNHFLYSKATDEFLVEEILGELGDVQDLPGECIDVVGLLVDHTKKLEKDIGYCAPRGLPQAGKVTADDIVPLEQTKEKMFAHSAGDPAMLKAAGTLVLPSPTKEPSPPMKKNASYAASGSVSPASSARGHAALKPNKAAASTTDRRKSNARGPGTANLSESVPEVEISTQDISFPGCFPGATYRKRFTVWNRDSNARRFKINPLADGTIFSVQSTTKNYDASIPVVPGRPIEFEVTVCPPKPITTHESLQLGHARDSNRMNAEASHASQWTFINVDLHCECLPPSLNLPAQGVNFGPCYVFEDAVVRLPIKNMGSAGTFRVSSECSGCAPNIVSDPAEFTLDSGMTQEVKLTLTPTVEEDTVRGTIIFDNGVKKETLPFTARAVLPSATLRIGDETFDARTCGDLLLVADDSCVGKRSEKKFDVRNKSPLPLRFACDASVACGEGEVTVEPSGGVINPNSTLEFTAFVSPSTTGYVEGMLLIKVLGLRPPPPEQKHPFFGRCVSMAPKQRLHADPYAVVTPHSQHAMPADEAILCMVRVAADPAPMEVRLEPSILYSTVPVLVTQPNTREFTIYNGSNKPVEFWLNPPQGDNHPSVELDEANARRKKKKMKALEDAMMPTDALNSHEFDGLTLSFYPQRGMISAQCSMLVTAKFTPLRSGEYEVPVECYIAETKQSLYVHLAFAARGPHVSCTPDILDLGIIPWHTEAEGRLTLSNFSPIPLAFQLYSNAEAAMESEDEHKMVVLPSAGDLKPLQDATITVYVRGKEPGLYVDTLVVDVPGGIGTTVEVRAIVERPNLCFHPPIASFDVVPRGIPVSYTTYLRSLCAVDIDFCLVEVDVGEDMEVSIEPNEGTLHAGVQDLPITVTAIFKGTEPTSGVVGLFSDQIEEIVPLEVACNTISQLLVSVDTTTHRQEPDYSATADHFIRRLLGNLVAKAVDDAETAYHKPLTFQGTIATEPFVCCEALIKLTNFSSCISAYEVRPLALSVVQAALTGTHMGAGTTRGATMGATANDTVGGAKGGTLTQTNATSTMKKRRKQQLALSGALHTHAFQCKAWDGREDKEHRVAEELSKAYHVLLDGKGCSIELSNQYGPLAPHESMEIGVRVLSNLPGVYNDQIRVACDGLPPVDVPFSLTVTGQPVVIDPLTPGLSLQREGSAVPTVLFPPIVPGVATVSRKLHVTSRCPRDLEVDVSLLLQSSLLGISVVDNGNGGAKVTVAQPASSSSGDAKNTATVTPNRFIMKALESQELVFEYTPPATFRGEWKGTLLLKPRLAVTAYNEKFVVDEYYRLNWDKFADVVEREIAPEPLAAAAAAALEVRGVNKVRVRQPLITHPDIVKQGVVIDSVAKDVATPKKGAPALDSDSEGEDGAAVDPEYEARAKQQRILEAHQQQQRDDVRRFVAHRTQELVATSTTTMVPLEVDLVMMNVAPKLEATPAKLKYPLSSQQNRANCRRSVVFTNNSPTPFDFRLRTDGPFRVTKCAIESHMDHLPKPNLPNTRKTHPDSDPTMSMFRLSPLDSLCVTVELLEGAMYGINTKTTADGVLHVDFANGAQQTVPLHATIHVPTLVSEPSATMFKPSVETAEGKPQPKYVRQIELVNYSQCAAPFSIRHEPVRRDGGAGEELEADTETRLHKIQQSLGLTLAQSTLDPALLDDPSRFRITPTSGTVPAATLGLAPGKTTLHIHFEEEGVAQFESKYVVSVADGIGCSFTVKGISRQTEVVPT